MSAGNLDGVGDAASQEQSDQGNTKKCFVQYSLHRFEMSARRQDIIDNRYGFDGGDGFLSSSAQRANRTQGDCYERAGCRISRQRVQARRVSNVTKR
jgi:hypothetical protein